MHLSLLCAFLPSVVLRTTNRHTVYSLRCLRCISKWIRRYICSDYHFKDIYLVNIWICGYAVTKWIYGYVVTESESTYFRGCFKVAGYSTVKPTYEIVKKKQR